jgi:hypothetical protein
MVIVNNVAQQIMGDIETNHITEAIVAVPHSRRSDDQNAWIAVSELVAPLNMVRIAMLFQPLFKCIESILLQSAHLSVNSIAFIIRDMVFLPYVLFDDFFL